MTINQIKSGFSLVELLVVISIIGVLVAVGLASYVSVQQRARDTTRRNNVQDIASAMEQFFSDMNNQVYPNNGLGNCSYSEISNYFSGPLPRDPKSGAEYPCSATDTDFMICADLEMGGGNAEVPRVRNGNYTFGGDGSAFCIANRQ